MNVRLTADEATSLRVAIRMAQSTFTELVSMSASKEARAPFMDVIRTLHSADKKLGG